MLQFIKYHRYNIQEANQQPLDDSVRAKFEEEIQAKYKELIPKMIKANASFIAYYSNDGKSFVDVKPFNFTLELMDELDRINGDL